MTNRGDILFGAQFSPNQIELKGILEICYNFNGNRDRIIDEIIIKFFKDKGQNDYNRRKLGGNTFLALKAYQIVDSNGTLIPVGLALYGVKDDQEKLYFKLANHILLSLRGLDLIQTAHDMAINGEQFSLVTFRKWLEERGIVIPRGTSSMSSMRLWLEKAGVVVSENWDTNQEVLQKVMGATSQEVDALSSLTEEQKSYLKTLANLGTKKPLPSNEIEKLAT